MNAIKSKLQLFGITYIFICLFLFGSLCSLGASHKVILGIDHLLSKDQLDKLKGKQIGVVTNNTAINAEMKTTADLLKKHAAGEYKILAYFAPEHGLRGQYYASEHVQDDKDPDGIPVYSLHGATKKALPKYA